MSLELRLNDLDPIRVNREVTLKSHELNGPGCGLCWGREIEIAP